MMRSALPLALASMAMLLSPSPARADSDGYYCVGPGYIAFEIRGLESEGPHVLKVVRFGDGRAQQVGHVEMQDFQPHEMICGETSVRIAGWDRYYTAYTVAVSGSDAPVIVERVEDPTKEFSPSLFEDHMGNLGNWSQHGSRDLESPDTEYRYRLEITGSTRPVEGGLEHRTISSVVTLDLQGNEVGRLVVFDGTRFESIDT